jgi:hypothetical protein
MVRFVEVAMLHPSWSEVGGGRAMQLDHVPSLGSYGSAGTLLDLGPLCFLSLSGYVYPGPFFTPFSFHFIKDIVVFCTCIPTSSDKAMCGEVFASWYL